MKYVTLTPFAAPGDSNRTTSVSLPEGSMIQWVALDVSCTISDAGGPNIATFLWLSFSAAQNDPSEFARISIGALHVAASGASNSALHQTKFLGPGLGITVGKDPLVAHMGAQASTTNSSGYVTVGYLTPDEVRKPGHVSRFISLAKLSRPIGFSLPIGRKSALTSKVVTLWDAREAMMSALGQLLYAGQVIIENKQLWDTVIIGVADSLRPFPQAENELDAQLLLNLMDGYFSQGFGYIQNHLGGFGNFTLRSGIPLESKFPAFKDLLDDPLSVGIIELLERALSQQKPRRWISATFRSRSVAGLLESTGRPPKQLKS